MRPGLTRSSRPRSDDHRGRERSAPGRMQSTAELTMARVLLLVPARTYRATDFLVAASQMGLELVVGSDGALPLGGHPVVRVNPNDPQGSVARLLAESGAVDAVVAADTPMLVLAAAVAARLGLPNNRVE